MLRSVFGTTAGISLAMPVCRVKARSLKVKCKVKTKRKQRAYLNRYKTGNLGQERQEMYLVGGEAALAMPVRRVESRQVGHQDERGKHSG